MSDDTKRTLSARFREHVECHCPDERCGTLLDELRALEQRCAALEAERDAFKESLLDEAAAGAEIGKKIGARKDENFEQTVMRVASERDVAIQALRSIREDVAFVERETHGEDGLFFESLYNRAAAALEKIDAALSGAAKDAGKEMQTVCACGHPLGEHMHGGVVGQPVEDYCSTLDGCEHFTTHPAPDATKALLLTPEQFKASTLDAITASPDCAEGFLEEAHPGQFVRADATKALVEALEDSNGLLLALSAECGDATEQIAGQVADNRATLALARKDNDR